MNSPESTPEKGLSKNTLSIKPHPGYRDGSQVFVTTKRGTYQENSRIIQKMRDEGLSDEDIADKLDDEDAKTSARVKISHKEMYRQSDEDDYEHEDPLKGDVEATGGYPEDLKHSG